LARDQPLNRCPTHLGSKYSHYPPVLITKKFPFSEMAATLRPGRSDRACGRAQPPAPGGLASSTVSAQPEKASGGRERVSGMPGANFGTSRAMAVTGYRADQTPSP
jgi:hypothetical protein